MFDWIYHNRDAFMSSYVEIGHSFATAKKLQDDHNHFTLNSNVSIRFAGLLILVKIFTGLFVLTWEVLLTQFAGMVRRVQTQHCPIGYFSLEEINRLEKMEQGNTVV